MRKAIIFLFPVFLLLLLSGCSSENPAPVQSDPVDNLEKFSGVRYYEITVENLTPAGSQPLSPPVFASHNFRLNMFRLGAYASNEAAQIAQDANNAPMLTLLENSGNVYDYGSGAAPILPGESAVFQIAADNGYYQLSLISMLVNTNDGFTGLNSILLPLIGSRTIYTDAYDAGSEANTELSAHIPGPCCGSSFAGESTHQRIRRHSGITGVGDLDPNIYNWNDPVARITIRRIDSPFIGVPLKAYMSGAEEVPVSGGGDPDGSGRVLFKVNPLTGSLYFRISLNDVDPNGPAHIHIGGRGETGPVVVPLTANVAAQNEGTITGLSRELLWNIIAHPRDYYAQVHNAQYPAGAVRGQLHSKLFKFLTFR